MKPLYLFKLDTDTGKFTKTTIQDYEQKMTVSDKPYYRYELKGNLRFCQEYDIDRVKNNRLYSFNPSVKDAVEAMRVHLRTKKSKAQTEVTRCDYLLDKLKNVKG